MKLVVLLVALLLLCFSGQAQTLLAQESFETGVGYGYTSTTFDNRPSPSTEYFVREDNPISTFLNPVGSVDGTYFWACEGVKGRFSATYPAGNVTLNSIPVSGYTGLTVTVAFADARATSPTAEPGDFMRVQYSYDNVNYTTIDAFTGTAVGGSAWRRISDGAVLTTSLQNFVFNIGTPSGATLYVRVQADYFGASKEIAFDNIRVTGTVPAVAPPVLANIESTSVAYAEGAAAVQVTNSLTVTNPSNTTLTGATVQLQANVGILSASDVLSFTPGNNISGFYNTATRLLTLSGTASTANYQTALRSVRYVNTDAINATPGTRTAVFTVADGSRSSAITSRNIVVTASLNGPTLLNYTENFETNGEGTRYGSNTYNQNSQAFIRTSQNPVSGVSSTTYANIEQSGYWYAEGTKDNATGGVGTLQLAPVNATSFRDLHFIWRVGRGGNGWQPNDYVRLFYDRNDGNGLQLFGAFYGTGGATPEVRRDADLNGVADPAGTLLTSTLQEIDFTLPAALANQPDIDFRIDVANNGGEELAFDYIRITGVNNQPPVINAQTFSIAENSANNTVVGTVAASDPDAGQTLTYAITAGNTGGAFSINSSTGQLRVANSAALNFEATPAFALTVQVTDNAPSPLSASNTITINLTNVNEAPVVAPQTFSLAENSVNGTVVGMVVASDPDAGTTLTYSLTAGNTSGAFALNAATGQLTVANSAALDFETTPTFALTVSVSDGGLATTATITVNLTDAPNAAYVSSTTEQITRGVLAGATNQAILRIPVVLNGNIDQPLSVTSFTFSTAGTTLPADVAAARIYYTGTSSTFATTTLFGSVTAPGSGAIVLSGSQVLQPNTNYFWLAYDVAPTAAPGNLLDGTLPSLMVGGTSRTSTVTAPAGARTVINPSKVAGTALSFNGTTAGYVDLGTGNSNLVLGQQYTMEIWVKPAAASGNVLNGVLGYDPGTAGQRSPYISISENNRVEAGYGNGSSTITAGTANNTIATGQWNQIVATFSDNILSVYVNGTLYSQTIGGGSPVNTAVRYVGTLTPSATTFFKGDVDEVAMWTRALTQREIRLRRHLLLSGGETDLTSYLQFNEASGNVQDLISGASGPLTGTGVSRVISTAPVGTGISNLQSVSGSGNVTFTGTDVAINFTGSNTYTVSVARLNGRPQGIQPSGLVRYYNEAYWIINKYDGGTFSNAAVTYSLRPNTLSAADAATPATTLRMLKRDSKSDGAFDTPIAATAANLASSTVTFNVTSFSQTVIGTVGSSPLPVDLTDFTAEYKTSTVVVTWHTASEKNSQYFDVERSLDGRLFERIGTVAAAGTSTTSRAYTLSDSQLPAGAALFYYRLRQVDFDGTASYSVVRVVRPALATSAAYLSVYPNPTHDAVWVQLTGPAPAAIYTIFDITGRVVVQRPVTLGSTTTRLALTGLPVGVYLLRCGHLTHRITVE